MNAKQFEELLKSSDDMIPYIYDQDVLMSHADGKIWFQGGRGLMFEYEGEMYQVRLKRPFRVPWSKLIVEEVKD